MNPRMARLAVIAAFVSNCGAAHAESGPLDIAALTHCATEVAQLREQTPHLNQQNTKLDARRNAIMQRSAALQAEAAKHDQNDLRGDLAYQQQRKQHNEEALAFNAQIATFKNELTQANAVKADYDQNCSNRSYRRRDLETLAPAARDAMRKGMDDLQVPYVDAAVTVPVP